MKINVAVLFGGKSVEHEISIISAMQAIENINKEKYNIIPVYITKEGNFYSENDFTSIEKFISFNKSELVEVNFIKENKEVFLYKKINFFKQIKTKIDVFLPIVHGKNVEDGTLQGYLKTLDIPVCGPSVISAAIGQDKAASKDIFKVAGVSQTKYKWFLESQSPKVIKEEIKEIGYPVILKPANLGSSIGISVVDDAEEILDKIQEAFEYDDKVVVEEVLTNFTEYNISFLGTTKDFQVSPIEKVIKNEEFLSFEDKYTSGSKSKKNVQSKGMASLARKIPAKLDSNIESKIIEEATKAFIALNAQGVVRFDVIVDDKNNVYINEVNNIPGSLSYYFWQEVGIEYSELLDKIINIAISDYFTKSQMQTTFDSNVLAGYKKD